MSQKSRSFLLIIVLLIIVAAVVYFFAFAPKGGDQQQAGGAPAAIPVIVAPATQRDVPHLLGAVGTVEPLQSVIVRAQTEGTVTRILFEEGAPVQRDELLATIDERVLRATLGSAQAQLLGNESKLHSAQSDLTRYRNLAERNAISRQVLDQQEALVQQLQADVSRDKALIEDAQVRLSYASITSPLSGRAGIRQVDEGNFVRVGDEGGIVRVTQMHPISVLFAVPQASFAALRSMSGTPELSQVLVLDRDSGQELASGPIRAVDNLVRQGSGTVQVRAVFDNESEVLWPGQFVSVRVPVGISRGAIVVPSVAVRLGMESPYVYRLLADETVQMVPVRPGYRDEDTGITVIEEGLAAGDQVVVDGFIRLSPGARVRVAEPQGGSSAGNSAAPTASAVSAGAATSGNPLSGDSAK